jgi:superfamily II DNA or RNA helicase
MRDRHWGLNAVGFLREHLEESPGDHLRVATGFFTIAGQEMLREGFSTTAWILVGFEEDAPESEVENITLLIQAELETTHTLTYDVIRRLAEDLNERVRVVQTRYRRGDHAKVFVFGSRKAFLGSANLTIGGMKRNSESLNLVPDDQVENWIQHFDERWWDEFRTRDVTGQLRELLLDWLRFAEPFDAYLAACHAVLDSRVPVTPREDYLEPLSFQSVVARRAAASIARENERGHWIIASTGLGKTIMATHVSLLLFERQVIRNVVVIAPSRTQDEWARQMHSAGLSARVFSTSVLRRDPKGDSEIQSRVLEAELAVADSRTLIVIDESHEFRNRYMDRNGEVTERTFVERLGPVIKEQGVRVLLLTATPFAKSLQGINNQLMLLPHTGRGEGTLKLLNSYPHAIQTLDDIYRVPVVTVISYNTVRRHFSQSDETGTYVVYPDGNKGYINSLRPSVVEFTPLAVEPVLKHITLFTHELHRRMDPETQQRSQDGSSVMRQLLESMTSSPADLKRFLLKELKSPSKVKFRATRESRDKALTEILSHLNGDVATQDEKLAKLLEVLEEAQTATQKALVFVGRKETGTYLKSHLRSAGYKADFLSGDARNADALIKGFAPIANRRDPRTGIPIDVLITTDTIAAGVNLQDATTVIHYDPPWTADIFNQRNGRITRFRDNPARTRSILFSASDNLNKMKTLEARLQSADVFSSIDRIVSAFEEGEIEGEVLRAQAENRSSEVLLDFATLANHAERAAALRVGIVTARYASVDEIVTVSVLKIDGLPDAVAVSKSHGPKNKQPRVISDSEALQAFRCKELDEIAAVPFQTVDELYKNAILEYVEGHQLQGKLVTHIATVALIPISFPKHLFSASS